MAETFERLPGMPEIGGTVPETVERSLELFGEFPVVRQEKIVVLLPAAAVTGQRMAPAPERPFPGRGPVGGSCPENPAVDQIGFQMHDVPAGIALDADVDSGRLPKQPETLVVSVPDLEVIPVQTDGDPLSRQTSQCPGNSPVGEGVHGDVDGVTGGGQGPDVDGLKIFPRGIVFSGGKGSPPGQWGKRQGQKGQKDSGQKTSRTGQGKTGRERSPSGPGRNLFPPPVPFKITVLDPTTLYHG